MYWNLLYMYVNETAYTMYPLQRSFVSLSRIKFPTVFSEVAVSAQTVSFSGRRGLVGSVLAY